jgi:hypothetical protein
MVQRHSYWYRSTLERPRHAVSLQAVAVILKVAVSEPVDTT